MRHVATGNLPPVVRYGAYYKYVGEITTYMTGGFLCPRGRIIIQDELTVLVLL